MLTPTRSIAIGGKDYSLDGSFGTLKAIQEACAKDIVVVLSDVFEMNFIHLARLVAIGSGKDTDPIAESIVNDVGLMTQEYVVLKTEILAWLATAVSPQKDRQKKSEQMQKIVDGQKTKLSLGDNTASSASAS